MSLTATESKYLVGFNLVLQCTESYACMVYIWTKYRQCTDIYKSKYLLCSSQDRKNVLEKYMILITPREINPRTDYKTSQFLLIVSCRITRNKGINGIDD